MCKYAHDRVCLGSIRQRFDLSRHPEVFKNCKTNNVPSVHHHDKEHHHTTTQSSFPGDAVRTDQWLEGTLPSGDAIEELSR